MKKTFAVVGQDARQKAAGDYLERRGYGVVSADRVYEADFILLPLPLDEGKAPLARLLRAARPGALALGGKVSAGAKAAASAAGVELIDYFAREQLELLNTVPTAEGCLVLLLEHRGRTIWNNLFLVLGFGRVGHTLAGRLVALGGKVTVLARSPAQRAAARSIGCRTLPLASLQEALTRFDTVINTIPAPVLGEPELKRMAPGSLVLDLASEPGGTDRKAAAQCGINCVRALSLPMRFAPVTAGELVAQTVLEILGERGVL